eukprot:scaffold64882_cov75-Phaeocystis_antarctica.AAC.7
MHTRHLLVRLHLHLWRRVRTATASQRRGRGRGPQTVAAVAAHRVERLCVMGVQLAEVHARHVDILLQQLLDGVVKLLRLHEQLVHL